MELRARTPHFARLAAMTAAIAALLALVAGPATADAAKAKKRYPVVSSISPMNAKVGDTISIRGRYFVRGRNKNTVVFKADGQRAVFAKKTLGTAKLIRVVVPEGLRTVLGENRPTRVRVRILAQRFGKKFTAASKSPRITAEPLPVDGTDTGTGTGSGTGSGEPAPPAKVCPGDEDGDMLTSSLENSLGLDSCKADTDGDGVPDGYEYWSARDLNDDEYQEPNTYLPYPGKRPYPNPLDKDADRDHDGDSLPMLQEFRLWDRYGDKPAGGLLADGYRLYYSAGELYSLSTRAGGTGRRTPSQPAASYAKFTEFWNWATANGYDQVVLQDDMDLQWHDASGFKTFDIRDVNRNDVVDGGARVGYLSREDVPNDIDGDTWISDDERDEDADGLINYEEFSGRATPQYWKACYKAEKPYTIDYAGTDLTNPDTDSDGIRDGADDNDHDDIPNMMELSRNMASGHSDWGVKGQCNIDDTLVGPDGPDADSDPDPITVWHPFDYGRVNPFNPCLPYRLSRTCERHPIIGDGPAPFDGSTDWFALN